MAKQSKKEKLVYKSADLFHSVVEVLNKNEEYVFVGSFANIAHKHFRGYPLFELLISKVSEDRILRDLKHLGLAIESRVNEYEVYSDSLLFKIIISDEDNYFEDRVEINAKVFNIEYKLYFPSLKMHKRYLKKLGDFISLEDIKMLESLDAFDTEMFNVSSKIELYFSMMYMSIKGHNHSKGSSSCDLCRQVDMNRSVR